MTTMKTLALGSILGLAAMFAPSASAGDVSVGVGVGIPVAPEPIIVDGGYYDHVWVEPVYRSDFYGGGYHQVIVTPGYYQRVYRSGYYSRPGVNVGIGFGFGGSRHWHRH